MKSLLSCALTTGLLLGLGVSALRAQEQPQPPEPPQTPPPGAAVKSVTVIVEYYPPGQTQQFTNASAANNFARQKKAQGYKVNLNGNRVSFGRTQAQQLRRVFTGSNALNEAQAFIRRYKK